MGTFKERPNGRQGGRSQNSGEREKVQGCEKVQVASKCPYFDNIFLRMIKKHGMEYRVDGEEMGTPRQA